MRNPEKRFRLRVSMHSESSEISFSGNGVFIESSTEVGDEHARNIAKLYYGSEWSEDTKSLANKIESNYLPHRSITHHGSVTSLLIKGFGRYVFDNVLPASIRKALQRIPKNSLLLLELDDSASLIPWELVHTGDNFICLDHVLGRVEKDTTSPEPKSEVNRNISMLVVADPTGDLYEAQNEANYIISQLRGSKLRISRYGSEIRKKHYLDLLRSGRFEIIHYSGHSASNNKSGKSHHIFLDGNLYGSEIEALSSFKMPQIVFSNSCQSAASSLRKQDTGNTSLAGSYLKAGVGCCIAAIWLVSDIGSGHLASDFYRYLLFGSSLGEALLMSRRNAFKRWGYQDLVWGSYLLYGDPDLRLVKRD